MRRTFRISPLSAAATLALQSGLGATWAADECGPIPGGVEPVLVCSGASSLYPNGISYLEGSITSGLRLQVAPDLTIVRLPGSGNHGIDLATAGTDAIRIDMPAGVSISVDGSSAMGIKLKGFGDLHADVAGHISVAEPKGTPDGYFSSAVFLEAPDAAATGHLVVDHRAGSLRGRAWRSSGSALRTVVPGWRS